MAFGRSHAAVCLAGALLLLGCAAGQEIAYYAPPPGLTPETGVTLRGSRGDTFFLESRQYRAVWQIDGQPVEDPVWGWERPLLVTANEPHHLKVIYDWGAVAGGTEFAITAPPGSTIIVGADDEARQNRTQMWLVDGATGQVISEKRIVQLDYIAFSTVGLAGPSPSTIANRAIIVNRPFH